jgi:hypothetical protein
MSVLPDTPRAKSLLTSFSSSNGTIPVSAEVFVTAERDYAEKLLGLLDSVRSLKHPLTPDETKMFLDDGSVAEFANVVEQLVEPLVSASETILERLAPDPEMNNQSKQIIHSEGNFSILEFRERLTFLFCFGGFSVAEFSVSYRSFESNVNLSIVL